MTSKLTSLPSCKDVALLIMLITFTDFISALSTGDREGQKEDGLVHGQSKRRSDPDVLGVNMQARPGPQRLKRQNRGQSSRQANNHRTGPSAPSSSVNDAFQDCKPKDLNLPGESVFKKYSQQLRDTLEAATPADRQADVLKAFDLTVKSAQSSINTMAPFMSGGPTTTNKLGAQAEGQKEPTKPELDEKSKFGCALTVNSVSAMLNLVAGPSHVERAAGLIRLGTGILSTVGAFTGTASVLAAAAHPLGALATFLLSFMGNMGTSKMSEVVTKVLDQKFKRHRAENIRTQMKALKIKIKNIQQTVEYFDQEDKRTVLDLASMETKIRKAREKIENELTTFISTVQFQAQEIDSEQDTNFVHNAIFVYVLCKSASAILYLKEYDIMVQRGGYDNLLSGIEKSIENIHSVSKGDLKFLMEPSNPGEVFVAGRVIARGMNPRKVPLEWTASFQGKLTEEQRRAPSVAIAEFMDAIGSPLTANFPSGCHSIIQDGGFNIAAVLSRQHCGRNSDARSLRLVTRDNLKPDMFREYTRVNIDIIPKGNATNIYPLLETSGKTRRSGKTVRGEFPLLLANIHVESCDEVGKREAANLQRDRDIAAATVSGQNDLKCGEKLKKVLSDMYEGFKDLFLQRKMFQVVENHEKLRQTVCVPRNATDFYFLKMGSQEDKYYIINGYTGLPVVSQQKMLNSPKPGFESLIVQVDEDYVRQGKVLTAFRLRKCEEPYTGKLQEK